MNKISLGFLSFGIMTIVVGCMDKAPVNENITVIENNVVIDCQQLMDNMSEYDPVIITQDRGADTVDAYFSVSYPNSPQGLYWGYNNDDKAIVKVGIDQDSLYLVQHNYKNIKHIEPTPNSPIYTRQVTLESEPGLLPYNQLEVQISEGGKNKGKGTLVSTRPIQPDGISANAQPTK